MRWILLLIAVGTSIYAQRELEDLDRVPSGFLVDGRLVDNHLDFSIAGPTSWQWFRPRSEAGVYACISPTGGEYFSLRISERYIGELQLGDVQLIIADISRRHGRELVDEEKTMYRAVDYPMPNSWYVTYTTMNSADIRVGYQTYLAKREKLFIFQTVSYDGTAPSGFKDFVLSFREIKNEITDTETIPASTEETHMEVPVESTLSPTPGQQTETRRKGGTIVAIFFLIIATMAGVVFFLRTRQQRENGQSPKGLGTKTLEHLREETQKNPDDMTGWKSYWERALALQEGDDLMIAGRKLLEDALKRGNPTSAYHYWQHLHHQRGPAAMPLALGNKLAYQLAPNGAREQAAQVLEVALAQPKASFRQLMQSLEMSLPLNRELGQRIYQVVHQHPGKTERDHQRLQEINTLLHQGQVDEGAGTNYPGRKLLVKDITLNRLDASGLEITMDSAQKRIGFTHLVALAVGVLGQQGEKPELVIDIILDDLRQDLQQYRILRARSRTTQIRKLLPNATSTNEAYKEFVRTLLEQSGAYPLPSLDSVLGKYMRVPDQKAWETRIYQ